MSSKQKVVVVAAVLICLVAIVLPRHKSRFESVPGPITHSSNDPSAATSAPVKSSLSRLRRNAPSNIPQESAEQIVACKASRFASLQRDVFYRMARKRKVSVPDDVDQFFAAAEAGKWEQLQALFRRLKAEREAQPDPSPLGHLWGPILATFNSLEEAHRWPAQQFLDYGNAILGSLKPGMVYVGGTDPGRGIPELLNATNEGEQHVVITQNGLADGAYVEYLSELYGDRLTLPSVQDSQAAFDAYVADAKNRYLHDQQFPQEPPQVRPGENISMDADGKVSVGGQTSVMLVNELILNDILQENPDKTFGLEESFPLQSTYAGAAPLGPIMQLRAQDGLRYDDGTGITGLPSSEPALTANTAGQSLAYWQDKVQQLLADPAASDSPDWLRAYSKMIDAQANLLVSHGLNDQAEQAFRLSLQVCPYSPEAVFGCVNLLVGENRTPDALAVAQSAAQADPSNQGLQALVVNLQNAQPGR